MKRHWLLAALLICGAAHAQNATIPGLTARGTPATTDQFIVWPNGATRAQSTYGSDLMTFITSQIFSGVTAAGNLAKWSASGVLAAGNLTGDVTTSNSLATTLANTAVTPGSYTKLNATIDAKGRITAASNGDNVVQNITSSPISPGPNVNASATVVYVTSSGSGGDEYINVPTGAGDVTNAGKTVVVSYLTRTNPADHIHVLVAASGDLYPLYFADGNFDSPPNVISGYKVVSTGAELDSAGQSTAFLRTFNGIAWTPYVVDWQDAAPYYSADIAIGTINQLAGSALAGGNVTLQPGAGDGAAAGGNVVITGGAGGTTGNGGNITLTPGTGHGGGTDGKVILSNVTGAAQCLEADTGGAVAGTGAPCGSGGTGTVTSVATSSGLTGGPITTTGTLSVTANVRTRSFGTSFGDTAGSVLASGSVVYFTVPYACTISAWNATVDAGTVTFDVWKIASGTAIPTVANTITAAALPAISAGTAKHSTTLTAWTTAVTANDIFAIQLNTVATARYAELDLECDQ